MRFSLASVLPIVATLMIVINLSEAAQPDDVRAKESPALFDVVIAGGRVIDPETGFDEIANVGIIRDTIASVSIEPLKGRRVIDASGHVVAPGFIDLHSHGQSKAADRMQAFDGVTTALELESGILPVSPWYARQAEVGRVLNYGTSAAWTFARIAELEGLVPEADLLWFQAAFAFRKWVGEPATAEQIDGMIARLETGLEEGAIGVGINAGYAPGGGYKELHAVHSLAAQHSVPTFTHISGDYPDDPDSAAEHVGAVISLSASTGSQSHICHINSSSLRDIATTRRMLLEGQAQGLAITTESYTYGASSTTIGAALFSESSRARKNIDTRDIELDGTPLGDERFAELRENQPGAVIVWRFLQMPEEEEILDKSVLFPGGAIASDAMPWTRKGTGLPVDDEQWPLGSNAFAHPRSAGTFTRLLSRWVRERGALSMSEAIEKSSLIPARILERSTPQMRKKGRIQAGMDADVIVFNPDTVQDKATFTEPFHPAVGMRFVFVNGVAVIENGELVLEAAPGQAVRRKVTSDEVTAVVAGW